MTTNQQHISLGEALGNNKVPPYWAPGCGTLFSDYLRDLEGWIRGTELQVPAQANAIYQRLGGTARMIAREIPAAELAEGHDEEDTEEKERQNTAAINAGYGVPFPPGTTGPNIHRTGVQVLVRALRGAGFDSDTQVNQMESLHDWDHFRRGPSESVVDTIIRFDLTRTRAVRDGGATINTVSCANKLLQVIGASKEDYARLLSNLQGRLPQSAEEYRAFIDHLKRTVQLTKCPLIGRNSTDNTHHKPRYYSIGDDVGQQQHYWSQNVRDHDVHGALGWSDAPYSSYLSQSRPDHGNLFGDSSSSNDNDTVNPWNSDTAYVCHSCGDTSIYFQDYDELEFLEDTQDSDEDLDFGDPRAAEMIFAEFAQAAAEWTNTPLPPDIEDKYESFLMQARKWRKVRDFGRRRRDHDKPRRRDDDRGGRRHDDDRGSRSDDRGSRFSSGRRDASRGSSRFSERPRF